MSDSVRPHRRQPTRLPRPWDSPGKNTRVGCDFLLQCMKVKTESEVAQSCPTLHDPMECSLPGCSIHGRVQFFVTLWTVACQAPLSIPMATILDWVAVFLLQGNLSDPGIEPTSSALVGRFFTNSSTWEPHRAQ